MIPKEWRDYTWQVRPLVVLIYLLVSPTVVLPLMWLFTRQGVDWPAWVQAVGSVAAILVAVGVANHQGKAQAKLRLEDQTERLKKIVAVANHSAKVARHAHDYLSLGDPEALDVRRFVVSLEDCIFLLKSVGYIDVPFSEVALGWIEVRHGLTDVLNVLSSRPCEELDGRDMLSMELSCNRIHRACQRIRGAASVVIPELLAESWTDGQADRTT